MTRSYRGRPLPEWRTPTDPSRPPLFTRVQLVPTVDGFGPAYIVTLGLLPLAVFRPGSVHTLTPVDEDAAHFLGAICLELDVMTNPGASSAPNAFAIDTFLSSLLHGWSAEEAFYWLADMCRANRGTDSSAPYPLSQGLA